jgi:hypothetical protein
MVSGTRALPDHLLFVLLFALLFGALARFAPAQQAGAAVAGHPIAGNACEQCHAQELAAEAGHPHRSFGIGCVDCHGGDGTKADKVAAKAAGTGYRGALARAAIPQLCGDCHADVARMNPFGLPTDQLAQYRTSVHGQGLFGRHDAKVAVCTDCHGAHGIREPRDPASPVHPRNVPATCGKCHADAATMAPYQREARVLDDWRQSVHGKLLLEKGDVSAPQCATCHGHHGAVPPGFATVAAVCGKCHVRENEFFRQSPHRKIEDQEFNTCVICHSNHKVRPATPGIYETACRVCHAPGDKGMAQKELLAGTLRAAADAVASAEQRLERAQRLGFATPDDQVLLETARSTFAQLGPAQHALAHEQLAPIAKETQAAVERLQQRLAQGEADADGRRLAILPVVLFLSVMSFGAWLRFRRIHRALPHAVTDAPA